MPNWLRRLLRIEPAVSLGSWAISSLYNIITSWALIWAAVGAIVVTWSGIVQGYPFGIHGLAVSAFITAIVTYFVVVWGRLWTARRSVERATERYIEARISKSTVNPLDVTFVKQRIDLRDLIRPLTSEVKDKTFVQCQIVGPINLVLIGNTNMANPS